MTDELFTKWLKDATGIRCVLMEVRAKVGGAETTRYLSSKGYVTGGSDVPANTNYSPVIVGGVKFTETLPLDGAASLSFGDIEIDNVTGQRDSWMDDIWANRPVNIYIGDVRWPRSDFRLIFSGLVVNIDTKNSGRLNLKLGDKLQRLNTTLSEIKLGGSTPRKDTLIPLSFGECHNVSPLLVDSTVNEYQVHNGSIELIIEVRDNGVPVAFTPLLAVGKFRLAKQPFGIVTCSVQGDSRPFYSNGIAACAVKIAAEYGRADQRFNTKVALTTQDTGTKLSVSQLASFSRSSIGTRVGPTGLIETLDAGVPRLDFDMDTLTPLGVLVEPAAVNLFVYSRADTAQAGWGLGPSLSRVGSTVAPDGTNTATVYTTTSTGNAFVTQSKSLAASTVYTLSIYAKLISGTVPTTGALIISDHDADGAPATAERTSLGWSGLTSKWKRFSLTFTSIAAGNFGQYFCTDFGNGANIAIWGAQLEASSSATSLINTTTGPFGRDADTGTVYDDFARESFLNFELANKQPIGLFLKDRANVLESINSLVSSVGGRLTVNRAGKLALVTISLPRPSAGRRITSTDMVEKSIALSQFPTVVAGVKLGYCKNYTVQDNLQTGIPLDHTAMFANEWLSVTQTDSLASVDYFTYTEPALIETLLIDAADALTESTRRLRMVSSQRKVFKYTGLSHLLLEELGGSQTIVHDRFGLKLGATGQIMSLATDWLNPHTTIEVMI